MITVGTISGSFGTRGLIKIKSFCEPAESIKIYDPIYIEGILEPAELKFLARHKTSLTASVSGMTNKEITEKLIGKKLLIKRQSLPELEEDEFYHSDLLQCE
ncbi:MAG: ribosome maturation factor RimM, partial [Rhodobacteraceae bacterium]